ncbi:MAG: hypothetical protein HRT61_08835 [Ekhidna sp.]|nr:hypothetical protein [Ekhidna sp.]
MTNQEFDIIDELYFVTPYSQLKEQTEYSDDILSENLIRLIQKGWVKVYSSIDIEIAYDEASFQDSFKTYFYLASKKGLLRHNT